MGKLIWLLEHITYNVYTMGKLIWLLEHNTYNVHTMGKLICLLEHNTYNVYTTLFEDAVPTSLHMPASIKYLHRIRQREKETPVPGV
jgi:hypothetical protein